MSIQSALARVAQLEAHMGLLQTQGRGASSSGAVRTSTPQTTTGGTFQQALTAAVTAQAPSSSASVTALPAASVAGVDPALGYLPVSEGSYAYPLGVKGELIGLPYQGTHSLGNWESDNALDLGIPVGTPVYALADGEIGSQIGPLNSSDPHLQGERLHLFTPTNEFYYAHLSQIVVRPGQQVRAGELIGYSGTANGVPHLHLAAKNGSPVDFMPAS